MSFKTLTVRRAVRQLKWKVINVDLNTIPLTSDIVIERINQAMSVTSDKWVYSAQGLNNNSTHCKIAFKNPSDALLIALLYT